ncbi:MAG: RNA 2',3'-cyclic phosphodiesterase [Anaerolineae bacterium]|nr:RNA 2',3'-cyclic phosphodiesterase [Anaerolineae bacterium]
MRIFIALPLPKATLQQLIRTTSIYHPQLKNEVRWLSPESLHLTLRFLGENQPDQVEAVRNALLQLSSLPCFLMNFSAYGVFPTWKSPSTIWLGIEKNNNLSNLYHMIETMMSACGYQPERKPFHPHLTFGRVRKKPSPEAADRIRSVFQNTTPNPPIAPFQARHVVLFQSILKSEGAQYRALQTIELQR